MAILTRDQILAANDIVTEVVPVPEWGGEVLVRGLTGAERDAFEKNIVEIKGKRTIVKDNIRAKFVAATVVDEAGHLLFDEADIYPLGKKSAAALDRVFAAAQRLSGLSDSDVEELEKN